MDELTKIAARAGLRRLRQALSGAERLEQQIAHSGASRQLVDALAKHKGDIAHLTSNPAALGAGRHLPYGSQLRVLGQGGEGVAQHVVRPGAGRTEVLKVHDPHSGAYSPEVIKNKDALVGREIPGVATIHGRTTMPGNVRGQQAPAYFTEYVPGASATRAQIEANPQQFAPLVHSAENAVPGMKLLDIERRPGNIKMTPQGPKAIDYMPVASGDVLPHDVRQQMPPNMLGMMMHDESPTLQSFRNSGDHAARSSGELLSQAYGRAPAARAAAPTAAAAQATNAARPAAQPATAAARPAAQQPPTAATNPGRRPMPPANNLPSNPYAPTTMQTPGVAPTLVQTRGMR